MVLVDLVHDNLVNDVNSNLCVNILKVLEHIYLKIYQINSKIENFTQEIENNVRNLNLKI